MRGSNHERARFGFLIALSLVLLSGCASVKIQKIDASGNASGPEGMRFYLPRPYVSVYEPFIVSAKSYLVRGQLSGDGNYVLINDTPPELKDLLTPGSGDAQLLSSRVTSSEEPTAAGGGPQGKANAAGDTGTGSSANAETPPPTTKPEPGVSNLKIINDNIAFATTPLRRYFDIVWLPDFEEQYVVQGKPGLGNSDITVTTGQGWSLQGLEAKIDNSALVKPLLELYANSLKLLEQVGRAKLGIPPIQGGAPQGKTVKEVVKPGTQLSIKITKVRVVAPGLYPLLKPKEYTDATKLLQDKNTDRVLVPIPPLTNIAFNTYDTLVVEAARTTGDSALRIHQYVDTTLPSGSPPTTDRAAQIKTQEGRLNTTQTGWKVSLREEAGKIKAVAEKDPSATNALAQDQVKANIKGAMGQIGATIDDADIVFK